MSNHEQRRACPEHRLARARKRGREADRRNVFRSARSARSVRSVRSAWWLLGPARGATRSSPASCGRLRAPGPRGSACGKPAWSALSVRRRPSRLQSRGGPADSLANAVRRGRPGREKARGVARRPRGRKKAPGPAAPPNRSPRRNLCRTPNPVMPTSAARRGGGRRCAEDAWTVGWRAPRRSRTHLPVLALGGKGGRSTQVDLPRGSRPGRFDGPSLRALLERQFVAGTDGDRFMSRRSEGVRQFARRARLAAQNLARSRSAPPNETRSRRRKWQPLPEVVCRSKKLACFATMAHPHRCCPVHP